MDLVNKKENPLVVTNTPLPGYTLSNLLRLLTQNNFHVDPRYLPRMVYCLTLSTVMTPFYIKERLQYDTRIKQTEITKHPLFILGFWRSGTTYLHNVLSLDKNLGYFTTFQAYLPSVFLASEKLFKPLVSSSIPAKRPMDDVAMDADFPQEDQYAIGALSPYSFYHGWCFPKNMELYYNSVCMDNVSKKTIDDWKKVYLYLLKKITLQQKGKQLVLKNQDNTGKIHLLLEMFPDAKFIYLYRNPYELYLSMMKFMRIVIPLYCVQIPPPMEILEQHMMNLYAKMMKKYLKEREQIPPGNLIEVRYENYIKQPLREVKTIYEELQLPGFIEAEPAFQTYLASQQNLKTDHYDITEDVQQKVEKNWGFALKEFGY
jgi:hypothetical protein